MALLYFDGFETAPNLRPQVSFDGPIASTTGRNGGRAIQSGSTGGGGANDDIIVTPGTSAAVGIVGFAAKWMSTLQSDASAFLIGILSDAGATTHLTLDVSVSGQLTLRRGVVSGTIIATSAASFTSDNWYYIEVKATIADSGGTCIVRVDGVEAINFTGDTKNGGTNTTVDNYRFGIRHNFPSQIQQLDDVVIMDATGAAPYNDFIGDRSIRAIRPSGNGATNQWMGSDADSTDNYLLVDEDPFSTADYTGSGTAGEQDIYAFSDLSITGTVDAVQVLSYVAKSDAGARSVKTLTRSSGGTVLASSDATLQTSYRVANSPILQTDADATAWTVTSVNSAQFGVEVV